jgi:hypothetical protein
MSSLLLFLRLSTAALTLVVCCSASAQVAAVNSFRPSTKPISETFCLNTKFVQGQPLEDLPMLRNLGVRWVRDAVPWSEFEPSPGTYADFPDAFKTRLAFYREHRIGVVFLLGMDNPVAYPNTPEAPANSVGAEPFARHAAAVAKKMRASGVQFVLEIWNEPHNFVLQKMLGGNWQGAAPSPWVDHYVRMVKATVEAVHKVDPKIELLSDDDMWVIHYWYLEAGLPRDLGGFAFHPYAAVPEVAAVAHDTDWTRPFTTVDVDRSFGSAVRRLREQGRAKLGHEPSMWATEWGWPSDGVGQGGTNTTAEDVARFLPRAFVLAAAAGVKATCWFSSQDSVDGPMGLTTNAREARPAYVAYRAMNRLIGPLVLKSKIHGLASPTSGVQAFRFEGGGLVRVVAWAVDGSFELRIPKKLSGVSASDIYGQAIAATVTADSVVIPLGPSPVYLQGLSDALFSQSLVKK